MNDMTPVRHSKQCFFVIWEQASGRKHLREGIWKASRGGIWGKQLGEGIWGETSEKASERKQLGGSI